MDSATCIEQAERLIAQLMAERRMSRAEAIFALATRDANARHFGLPPPVDGPRLDVLYADEIGTNVYFSFNQSARIVAYLLDISVEEAATELEYRESTGAISIMSCQ